MRDASHLPYRNCLIRSSYLALLVDYSRSVSLLLTGDSALMAENKNHMRVFLIWNNATSVVCTAGGRGALANQRELLNLNIGPVGWRSDAHSTKLSLNLTNFCMF